MNEAISISGLAISLVAALGTVAGVVVALAAKRESAAAKKTAEATERLAAASEEQTALLRDEQARIVTEQERLRAREDPNVRVTVLKCWALSRVVGTSCDVALSAVIENLSVNTETLRSADIQYRTNTYGLPPNSPSLTLMSREQPNLRVPFVLQPKLALTVEFQFKSMTFDPPDDSRQPADLRLDFGNAGRVETTFYVFNPPRAYVPRKGGCR